MSEVLKSLNKAMGEICRLGIGKSQKNEQQGFHFRGIEAAMNEMSPILVRNGVIVVPKYSEMTIHERVKGNPADGKATRFATVKGSFTFSSMVDGSSVEAEAYGEAMDSGDKALTKAQSVSFRTALFQLFVVPTMAMDPEASEYDAPDESKELDAAREAALDGSEALKKWWMSQTPAVRTRLAKELPALKEAAAKVEA